MKLSFRDLPIKTKLMLVMLLTSATVLMLVCLTALAYEYRRYHQNIERDLTTEAEIIGVNTAAALVFNDVNAAQETLAVLHARREIVAAQLFKPDGRLFAQYLRPGATGGTNVPTAGIRYEGGEAIFCQSIRLQNDWAGYICLHADLSAQQASIRVYAGIMLGVLLASMGIALVLATRLQRLISDPVLALTRAAQEVSEEKNYSVRAPKQTNDEIGFLTDAFNEMLARIGRRDLALQASEERFRQIAENIPEVFWMTNLEKTEIIYVSPGYEKIWGRGCASLYADPREWGMAIHPEDRTRVWTSALEKQISGEFDEEYRITRPDGMVRWIHSRAFPIRDKAGKIYRVAGIAEDVTERRQLEAEILKISEREQARIGQDLHDGLCQHLVRTALAGNLLERDLVARGVPEAASAKKISKLLQDALDQTRAVARGLYPVKLEAEGLASALSEMAVSLCHQASVRFTVDCETPVLVADHLMAVHLYRIAQEAVSNALRHAAPAEIVIALRVVDEKILLQISDDGTGISKTEPPGPGMGLSIMAYRAHTIGGTLTVGRRPEGGTVVACSVAPKVV